jgi:gliding motility-associated-like protein
MKRFYPLLVLSSIAFYPCLAQVDTEFWFAPPEVTAGHGDRPLYLRVSTLDKAANVRVLMPAMGNMQLANVNVAANTTQTIDLTNQISLLETAIPATVMRTGIKVISSSPVTVYYEVGAQWNTDIFALKGKNALGNKFIIPAQNYYDNSGRYYPVAYFSFDIVATSNNTIVTVRPTKPLRGHGTDTVITVKLNAGETYSFWKISQRAIDNPVGTLVESNKPIAITIKDDSVSNASCDDILGDQLVPVEVTGTEYVVMRGFLNTNLPEFIFITATEDDTEIFVGTSKIATLDAGELWRHQIYNQATFVRATHPVYVMHVTGFGCELGMAILPSITCKGSQQIGFSRTTQEFLGLNVLVRKEGINNFKLNGSSTLVPPSYFYAVPGTGDKWYAAQLSFTTSQIPVGQGNLISNDLYSFQVGIINGDATTSCRYGYFSSFSTLFIGDDFNICEGATATLDAGPGKESYLWNTGATEMTIEIDDPGTYWVRVEKEDCILYDTINVDVKKGKIDLGPDTAFCEDALATVDGKENFSWLWSDGTQERYLKTKVPGKYWISVFDYNGCHASDTINLNAIPLPTLDLGEDIIKCPSEEVILDATTPAATYTWNDGVNTAIRSVKDAGLYWCGATVNGCTAYDSVNIENLPGPPQESIFGSPSVCPFVKEVEYRVEESDDTSYEWFVNGGDIVNNDGAAVKIDWRQSTNEAYVRALVTNSLGCKSDTINFPVRINVELVVELPDGPDSLCLNMSNNVLYVTSPTNGSVYNWLMEGGDIVNGQGTPQVTINWREGKNKLWIEESSVTVDTVCAGTSPQLDVYVFADETAVNINYVSVDTVDDSKVHIQWDVLLEDGVDVDSVYLFKREALTTDWQILAQLTAQTTSFVNTGNETDHSAYEYQVRLLNRCGETVRSAIHKTVRLLGVSDTLANTFLFSWTPYQGWPQGVDHYELWQKLDNESGFRLIKSIPGSETGVSAGKTTDGFLHEYLIRAVEKSGINESWSNSIGFEFKHPVFVPNVFTPNGDEYNPYFEIRNITLYKDSILKIMNRWGKLIYESKGYLNDWNGEGMASGVYFYVLDLNKNNVVLKGTLSILR